MLCLPLWASFGLLIIGQILPLRLESFGITPRTLGGLIGIPAAPFLHANLAHLINNTIPLTVLLVLLAGSKAQSWAIVTYVVLLSGLLLWLFGRPAPHIGASSLIYGLVAYLMVSGIWAALSTWQKRIGLAHTIALLVVTWGALLSADRILPRIGYAEQHATWRCQ